MNAGQRTAEDLLIYLRMLAGNALPSQFFDVRCVTPAGGMRQWFVSVLAIHETARLITRLARRTDVYVGVALRDGRGHGGKSAISGSHLLYIECDDPDAGERLHGFSCSPSMIVASGFIRSCSLPVHAPPGCDCRRHVANGWDVGDTRGAATSSFVCGCVVSCAGGGR